MAGFEVIIYGRFWVIAEGSTTLRRPAARLEGAPQREGRL
jgi:hypothetical protein